MSTQADSKKIIELASQGSSADSVPIRKVAALDLGSNSFHLVVARIVAHDVQILHQMRLRVQLADGLNDDKRLSKKAIDRGIENLRNMAESLNDFEPDQVRIVGTYTLREAGNAGRFVRAAARKILPYPIEIVSGIEEARLIYLGVAHTNHHDGNRLVIDIGGGSTEMVIGEGFEPKILRSLSMGCVTFAHKYFKGGQIRARSFNKAIKDARQEIEPVSESFRRESWAHCLGSSGTIRNIVRIVDEMGAGVTPNLVTSKDLKQLIQECIEAGHEDKLDFPAMSEQRRHVFAPGLAILMALFESLGIDALEYSTGALREGVIYEMEDRLSDIDIRDRTAQSLVTRYVVDLDQARRVETTTLQLYDQVKKTWRMDREDLRDTLSRAALLHEVGLQIHSRDVHTHSAYILGNVEMPGFKREEQLLLATIVGSHRKKIRAEEFGEFLVYSKREVRRLIALLRLGVLLNFKRQDDILPEMRLTARKTEMSLHFPEDWLEARPVLMANLDREQDQIEALG